MVPAGGPVAAVEFGSRSEQDLPVLLEAPVRWPSPDVLSEPLSILPGVGPKLGERALEAGVEDLGDLLWRVPGRYSEAPDSALLGDLEPGQRATVTVEVLSARRVRTRGRSAGLVEARVRDSSGTGRAVWFNRPWVSGQLSGGGTWILEGRMAERGFSVEEHRQATGATDRPGDPEGPRPVHRAGGSIPRARWGRWTALACRVADRIEEPLPASVLHRNRLPGALSALREVHLPEDDRRADLARERLAYEELFLHQTLIASRARRERRKAGRAPVLDDRGGLVANWLPGLPFGLTSDQEAAIDEVLSDSGGSEPMRRLLMGDVGSGKTVVALAGLLTAVSSGHQAALLAPTELLADQHLTTLRSLLGGQRDLVRLLTGSTPSDERERILAEFRSGDPVIAVGTHALLQESVEFGRLAFVVVDEEHRFGVRQRMGLDPAGEGGPAVHRLHLSATPIPRSLALTAWGDLDLTVIRTLPAGREPIETEVVSGTGREKAFGKVRGEVAEGRQAFIVCPLVNESESVQARAAESEAVRLAAEELNGLEIGLVHGQMPREQRDEVMDRFGAGEVEVLVATTVIEVGIDYPNATVIVIEGAESFGMAQLHQLRGRVGRGKWPGHCFLASDSEAPRATRRLAAVAAEQDGFRLAELDLEMRGEGELAGRRQHGLPRYRVAVLPEDAPILEAAGRDLARVIREEGGLEGPILAPSVAAAGRRFGPAGVV